MIQFANGIIIGGNGAGGGGGGSFFDFFLSFFAFGSGAGGSGIGAASSRLGKGIELIFLKGKEILDPRDERNENDIDNAIKSAIKAIKK